MPGCGAVLANAGQAGYYRTRYAPAAFAPLTSAFPGWPAIELGVPANAWSLGLSGLQPMNDYLALARVATEHPDLAFDFAIAHRAGVDASVDSNSRSRFNPQLATASADAGMLGKLDAYARAHLAEGSRRDAETAKAGIAFRIKVRAARLAEVDAWLARS